MPQFGPPAWLVDQNVESRDGGDSQELGKAVSRQDDVDVLGHSADESVPPNRPASPHDGLTAHHRQDSVDGAHGSAVSPRQILRLKHDADSVPEQFGNRQLLDQGGR
jgi:hypothetical protein